MELLEEVRFGNFAALAEIAGKIAGAARASGDPNEREVTSPCKRAFFVAPGDPRMQKQPFAIGPRPLWPMQKQ